MQAQTKEVHKIWTSEIRRLLEAQFTLIKGQYNNIIHMIERVVVRMRTYYIPFVHVAKSINWLRNLLVCSPYLSKDL